MTEDRPVEREFDGPATLADLESFCRTAREQGGSDDDEVTTGPFRMRIRGLRCKITVAHNREAAHRREVGW